MGRDLLLSIILHLMVFAITIYASPLNIRKPPEFGEVIRVGVVSVPEPRPAAVEPIPEAVTPQAVQAEPEEIALDDPTTRPAAEIDEPAEKPKDEPEEKPKPTQPATTGDEDQAGRAEGDTEVEAPTGGAIAGAMVADAAFNYPYWFNLAFNKINQSHRVPFTIEGKVECVVYFEVIGSGRVIELKVLQSSGIPQYDDACLASIGRAAPFPPLPREFLPELIGLTITLSNEY